MRMDIDQDEFVEDPPEPYRPREPYQLPPLYHAYNPPSDIENSKFPAGAVTFALRASIPPQSTMVADLDKDEREEVEEEQGQYFRSIKYGDQRNKGLDELTRFQEDLITEVGEMSGLTTEQIQRRRKLSSWDDDRDDFESQPEVDIAEIEDLHSYHTTA
jgi:hypothetical protein